MIYAQANSMPALTSVKVLHSAKTVVPIANLIDVRGWLLSNCKQRWKATDFKGLPFNWRKAGKINLDMQKYYFVDMDITLMVHFNKPEDLMLYLLTWPSDVLLNA